MKITDVEAIVLRRHEPARDISDGTQDALVVRITTDEGLVGIGEVDSSPEVVKAAIEAPKSHLTSCGLRQLLLGEDPRDIARLWEKCYRGSLYFGRRGVGIHALSGIDIALWDLAGKAAGQPVWRLLGGAYRDRVRAYASTLMPDTPVEAGREAQKWAAQGFTAVKLGWGPLGNDAKHDVRLAAAAKEAAGDGEILIDAGFGYRGDPKTAIGVARELEQLGVFWLEEPFEPDEYEAYAELADTVDIRVAAGEQDTTVWGFRELIERGRVDLVQPDVTRCGGITEWLRIAELAREHGLETVPHAWKSGIIKAASLQCNAVIPDALFQEYCVADTPINQTLTHERLPLDEDGYVRVPTAPGIGVTLDDEVVARYRVN